MLKRSAAQQEVVALKESLAKAQDAFTVQQQQLKQLQLRERLRAVRHGDEDEDEDGGADAAAVESEAAHTGLGLLLLSNELTLLERAWMSEKGAAAELVAIKANMSFRVAQVEDDNHGLQAEVARLKGRIAATLQRGEALEVATTHAVEAWHKQLVRKQIQQSTWDPSANTSRKVSGVVRFMPFKHTDAEYLEYEFAPKTRA